MIRCLTSALICSSARSSWVMASTVELMDSTPRTMGGRTRFSSRADDNVFDLPVGEAGERVILMTYFSGETAVKEKAPFASD